MSAVKAVEEVRRAPPETKVFDEGLWKAWVARGLERDRRGSAARMKAVTWFSMGGLLAIAAPWWRLAEYEVVFRFGVAAGAVATALHAWHLRRFVLAAMLVGLALLYNPVFPVLHFSADAGRMLVVVSIVPFAAALALSGNAEEAARA